MIGEIKEARNTVVEARMIIEEEKEKDKRKNNIIINLAPKTWLVCWSNNKYGIGQLKAPRIVSACLMMSTHAKNLATKGVDGSK